MGDSLLMGEDAPMRDTLTVRFASASGVPPRHLVRPVRQAASAPVVDRSRKAGAGAGDLQHPFVSSAGLSRLVNSDASAATVYAWDKQGSGSRGGGGAGGGAMFTWRRRLARGPTTATGERGEGRGASPMECISADFLFEMRFSRVLKDVHSAAADF